MPIGTEIIELYLPEDIMSGFDDHIDDGMRHSGLVPTKEEKRKQDQYAALRAENAKLRGILRRLLNDANQMCSDEGWPELDTAEEARAALKD